MSSSPALDSMSEKMHRMRAAAALKAEVAKKKKMENSHRMKIKRAQATGNLLLAGLLCHLGPFSSPFVLETPSSNPTFDFSDVSPDMLVS